MFVIGIGGGTCSGKSTLTEKLSAVYGDNCSVIHMDSYFRQPFIKTIAPISGVEYIEHNHPDSLRLEELYADFDTAYTTNKKIIIIEGLFALYLPKIREKCDMKLFVDLASDERLVRRIKRFMAMGQSFEEITDRYIDTVRFRHNELIEPTRWHADLVINGNFQNKTVDMLTAWIDQAAGISR